MGEIKTLTKQKGRNIQMRRWLEEKERVKIAMCVEEICRAAGSWEELCWLTLGLSVLESINRLRVVSGERASRDLLFHCDRGEQLRWMLPQLSFLSTVRVYSSIHLYHLIIHDTC